MSKEKRSLFYSGKIYHAKDNGDGGHIQTGYFSVVCDVTKDESMQEVLNEITDYVAENYDVESKCIHIENMQWV